ncbi:MAG: coproporphyrinogen dehydrogenase HemZ [Lachnospiraceae bacterium]|nr:coproporphyrinogen dehydrogenase HemZ [Lachnospiraceae bacterium]
MIQDTKKVKIYISGIDISQAIRPLIQSFFGNIEYEYAYVDNDEINYGEAQIVSGELSVRCGFSEKAVCCKIAAKVGGSTKALLIEGSSEEMPEDIAEYRYAAGRLIYDMLSQLTGKTLPWGVMIGIRPTKHAYEALERGKSEDEIKARFEKELYVSSERAEIAVDIAKRELDILRGFDYRNGYSLYIGIPFCPTTCLYCSFTSYPVERFGYLMDDYLTSLEREMAYASTAFSGENGSKKKNLNTIYIGGGTPTALSEAGLVRLLTAVHKYFPVESTLEFCVEAGRPDSLNPEKLRILKEYGVNRISINPQSMNQKTLELIGRKHTVEQVYEAFKMARAAGHENINLDMIIGLHGETPEDVAHTLSCVKELDPESLTVHTLAIKRAARLKLENDRYKDLAAKDVEKAAELAMKFASENAYHPYYLYRQKNMAENLENIGYAREGKEGLYNILIMEEKQTILALGAGATTKYVFPEKILEDGSSEVRIERVENVKSLTDYISRVDEMIERKKEAFAAWN